MRNVKRGKWTAASAVRRASLLILMAVTALALSGCLYPEEETPGNNASARQAVLSVQDAVDQYQKATGLLPIVSADESVPLYEKFKIDMGKLKRMDYLGSVPSVAFESGGNYQFLIIDEETKPTVKLLNISVYQNAGDVQTKVDAYMDKHGGEPPKGDELYPGFWSVNFDKLGMKEPKTNSMYSGQSLGFMTDASGRVYVDYGLDIATAVGKSGTSPAAGDDLRRSLVDQSYYVPVKAPVYHWVNGEPQAQPDTAASSQSS
ncbi:hypothetical protein [Cohnella zeiphila]|uniref:Uncharacterized protein n=1 Tax=Cohnella zeiphila TaxID=2761120 RepID=A0A7X0SXK9_9BACL|nr:hypothetical protein [Cohnella zeiphila]MBB6735768.1 hypothetical protein [Cohnella zeiphila]